ncbi:MAG: RND transporter [Candidatus Dactylopiibacterium carminicum]|uniref:RND transporter n=1 Tax=Candidatus Dactylopiibacterium carminicum TaxID=857335 RepID=A0A272EZ18_9RHOO|nr:efflux transporter outer membrane subunit [Candidatus Dactylopiibacterium carminicum]KAF7600854.1 RND transporter [Candidatus Dactylopiibacterium carminicum]PAS95353.1 MAG: RND transporter [Candidatus Dactylopiibacterium carminicum]PAS98636.1 MAG: RND transporter [Candidatus Dactylopiibacterium carminicum]PAT00857.1 MAG: RND transporter [Candidatus Dactylopiibacterium carminicum]
MRNHHLSVFAGCLLLSACASLVRTEYTPPVMDLPANWQNADVAIAGHVEDAWWQAFQDPRLDDYVALALARNTDLASAAVSLRRARLNAGLADDALRPQPGASAGQSVSRNLDGGGISRSYSATVTLSWEADFWGKLASARDAAEWEARASAEDLENTRLTLIGDTARAYWQLGYLNQRVVLSAQSVGYLETTRDLAQRRHAAGAVSRLDLLQAEQSLATQLASHAQLLQQREEARTSFRLLFSGALPAALEEPQVLPESDLPTLPAELPASLLQRRPDLRAAELRLRGTLASGDETRLSYYPGFSLTGSLGSSSDRLRDVLSNPVGALAGELTLPFLRVREMQLKTDVARADYELAELAFRKSLYAALGDVENALSARSQYVLSHRLLARSLVLAREVERISELRYRAGAIEMQDWLDAQEKRRSAEVSLAENRFNLLDAQLTLNLALGGAAR